MNTEINGFFPRVSLSFAGKINTDLIAFVRNVIALTTGNPKYPTPSPSLATITTSVDAFEVAVQDAFDGGRIAMATRKAARVELLSLMRQLAAYVQGNCEGDLVVVWVQSDQGRDVYEVALVAVLVQSVWDLIAFVAWVRPMERAQLVAKQFRNLPDVISESCRHCWGHRTPVLSGRAQFLMRPTEVVGTADQIHARF